MSRQRFLPSSFLVTTVLAAAGLWLPGCGSSDGLGGTGVSAGTGTAPAPGTPADPTPPAEPTNPTNPTTPTNPTNPTTPTDPTTPTTPATPTTVRFLAFGDAGRANANQTAVGAAMAQFCRLKRCDFAVELGDNFYDTGVTSTTDAQWQTKFETPYKDLNIPIYATLGNHDNSQSSSGEGGMQAKGASQVDYTTATGTTVSGKWKLPARYHAFTAPLRAVSGETPVAEFFCLDSSPLAATVFNPAETGFNYLTYGPTQMQWLQMGLKNSKAKWRFAYAHHPYISNGAHGNAGTFEGLPAATPGTANGAPWKSLLDQTICAEGVDMFLFGHDHDLEWLKPVAGCNAKTEFVLSGAGSDVRTFGDANRNPAFWQKENAQGFFWFEVTANTLKGESYTLENGVLPLNAQGQPAPAFTRTVTK